jgi:nifR3 family TIM-barrel protein
VLRIGKATIEPPLILAPMAGITDRDFRLAIRRLGGCGLVSMEFISSEGLVRQRPSTLRMLHFVAEEQPIAVQIYGSEPEKMAAAARAVEEIGADICDINMGCPANKVLKGCAGAALMADLPRAQSIIRTVRAAVRMPLSVKFRVGMRDGDTTYLELGRICEGEGVEAVTLHARSARQQFSGRADWGHIARLKQALSIPVIGNGDVETPEDACRLMAETGCDGAMIGRASLTNPWIFRQAAALLAGERDRDATVAERHGLISWHFAAVLEREDERTALHKLRKFTGWYTHGLPDGRLLRRRLSELPTAAAVAAAVEEFFAQRSAA